MTAKIGLTNVNHVPLYVVGAFSQHQGRIYGAQHDTRAGRWYHPAYYPFHATAIDDYKAIFGDVELTAKAQEHLDNQTKLATADVIAPEFTWVTQPDDYQVESVAHGLRMLRSGILLDCGLGKTKVIIDVLRYLHWLAATGTPSPITHKQTAPKTLCLVKSSVLWNWPEEIAKHAGDDAFKVSVVDGYSKKKKVQAIEESRDSDFLIATYDQAAYGEYAALIKRHYPYDTIVADESHKLQSWSSSNTQTAVDLSRRAYRRMIATGTASLGDPRHVYGQLRFLAPHLVGESYYTFCDTYLKTSPYNKKIVIGYKGLDRLNAKLHSLGKVIRIDGRINTTRRTVRVGVDMSKEQRELYDMVLKEQLAVNPRTQDVVTLQEPVTRLGKAHEICCGFLGFHNKDPEICNDCKHLEHCIDNAIRPYTQRCKIQPKLPERDTLTITDVPKRQVMQDKLEEVLQDPENAVIITYRFRKDADNVRAAVQALGAKYLEVLPTTKPAELQELAKTFESDGTVRVFMAQISTLVGINLVRAKYIFFYSLSFDLKDYDQARGRNYRRTQKAPEIFEYIFYNKNSVESVLLEALDTKTDVKELLLARVDCSTCKHAVDGCIAKKVLPWRAGCVLERSVDKTTMKIPG